MEAQHSISSLRGADDTLSSLLWGLLRGHPLEEVTAAFLFKQQPPFRSQQLSLSCLIFSFVDCRYLVWAFSYFVITFYNIFIIYA